MGAEQAGVAVGERGFIAVDRQMRTNVAHIFAIGDIVGQPMLAHKAVHEAHVAAEVAAGEVSADDRLSRAAFDPRVIPSVAYTDPEIASVGLGDTDAKAQGYETKVGKFNFAGNGRAIATDATDGFAKVIADKKTDRILGVQLIGKGASELIASAVAHMEYGGSAEDLARTVHAHPTVSEAIKEAALAVDGNAIHSA